MALSKITDASVTNSTLTTTKLATPNLGRRNLIINGAMQVAQRGTSHATTGYGSLDRFQLNLSGGSCTMSQESLALGETAVTANINKFLRLTTTSGNDNLGFVQHIEGVDTYEGVVTFSLYAKGTNPAGGNLNIQVSQNFGTGGSPSSVVTLTEQTLTVTGTWTRYEFQFTLPSLTGKTKGTSGNDYIAIFIRQPDTATAAWTADFTGVQLEANSQATPFEHRSFGEELALCQRYFERTEGITSDARSVRGFALGGGVWYTANQLVAHFPFKQTKRTIPSISVSSSDALKAYNAGAAISSNDTSPCDVAGMNSARFNFIPASSGTAGQGTLIQLQEDESISIDAEL